MVLEKEINKLENNNNNEHIKKDYNTIEPEMFLLVAKHRCFIKLMTLKLGELFKERYYLETKRTYKDNPMHGEFIIEMMGEEKFNKFDTETQATIKTGIVSKWPSEVIYVLLLSYSWKNMDQKKLKEENYHLELMFEIDQSYQVCECCPNIENLKGLRYRLMDSYLAVRGKKSDIIKTLDSVVIANRTSTGENENNNLECIKNKERGNKLFNQGKFQEAIEEYSNAILNFNCHNFKIDFYLFSTLNLNLALAEYNSFCDSENMNKEKLVRMIHHGYYIEIERLIKICKFASEYTPSWSKVWARLSFYISKSQDINQLILANKYIDIAISLDSNNHEYKLLKYQLSNDLKSKFEINQLLKQVDEKGQDYVFHEIGKLYLNKLNFQIPIEIQNEFKSINIANGGTVKQTRSLWIQYYSNAMKHKSNGEFEFSFKSFCFSILTAQASGILDYENDQYILYVYYQLGLMYLNGNSFIKVNQRIAISLFYKSIIGDGSFSKKVTFKNQTGKICAMFELSKIYYESIHIYRCREISFYWLRRINLIEPLSFFKDNKFTIDKNPIESHIIADEMYAIGRSVYSLGSLLYFEKCENENKKVSAYNYPLLDSNHEAFKILSKGYLELDFKLCFKFMKNCNPIEAEKLKLKNPFLKNKKQHACCSSLVCTHLIGSTIFDNEYANQFRIIKLDYIKIKKFATHPLQPSIQAQRIIQCLDLVNQFINEFKSSISLKDKDKSIQYLADAFIYKKLYAIKIPDDVMPNLYDYLSKSITLTKNPTKSLSIVWIGCNCFNFIKRDSKEFIKRNEDMIEFIKKSINRFPKELIFKFFSSIFNRFNGNLEASLNDLNKCINSTNDQSSDIYYYYKADTLFFLNRYQESIESFNQYLIKSPFDGKWRIDSYYAIAHLKYDENNTAQNELNLKLAKESESKSLYCFLPFFSKYTKEKLCYNK